MLAHPDKKSFNHAIAERIKKQLAQNGYEVIFHDLYQEKFPPLLETEEIPKDGRVPELIHRYSIELAEADGIVIIHPNWWGMPPAILKGWIDRILRPGITYEFEENDSGEGIPIGLLKAKSALVFNTSNTSEDREIKLFNDPLETIWKNCIFDLCGVKNFYRKMFRIIVTSSKSEREAWLSEVNKITNKIFPKT